MSAPIYTVDSFTNEAFAGNPAAVCLLLDVPVPNDAILQKIAREMNLSETAFVSWKDKSSLQYNLRWLTPTTEVNLCGHATLATAHILLTETDLANSSQDVTLTFHTLSGALTVSKTPTGLQMNFPQGKPVKTPLSDDALSGMSQHLSLNKNNIKDTWYCSTTKKLVVEVSSFEDIQKLSVNADYLQKVNFGESNVRGVIVTVQDQKYDFLSRYFAPWVGIPEDPVTGSAHTVLGIYWSTKLNKTRMFARQASERGGDMYVELVDNGRVLLEGQAVTVLKGQIKF